MKNWKTTLFGLVALLLPILAYNNLITKEIAEAMLTLCIGFGFVSSADAKKVKDKVDNRQLWTVLLLCAMPFLFSSCTRANLSFLIQNIKENAPIERVEYTIPTVKSDTTYVFHSPYKIFSGVYRQDSINGTLKQELNWEGLEEFLWNSYQEYKQRKQKKKKR